MWEPRLSDGARMKYLGIVAALEADLRAGLIAPGERLPAQRAIAAALGLDLTTVTRAFNEARRRGLVEARAGRGTFAAGAPAGDRRHAAPGPVDLSMNIPPPPEGLDLPGLIARDIGAVLAAPGGGQALHYQLSTGAGADRQAAADWLSGRIPGVEPGRIAIAAGGQSALFVICDTLLERGEVIAAGAMTYPGLKAVAIQRGLVLEPLAMDAQGILPDALEHLCRSRVPRAVYVVPAIDNPTTATLPVGRRRALADIARRHGIMLIEDDPYSPLQPVSEPALAALAPELTWHVATLSKCATPALRVAYVVAPDAAAALRLAGTLRATVLMAPPLLAALASRWIADGVLTRLAGAIRSENRARQALAAAILGGFGPAADPHGHHLWLPIPPRRRAADFADHAQRAGVPVVPASTFATAAHPAEAVRVSLGTAADRGGLEAGLTQIAALMARPPVSIRAVV